MSPSFAEFDAERRAFSKLEIKKIRHQQAHDTVEADMMAKLEARDATLSGETCTAQCLYLNCHKARHYVAQQLSSNLGEPCRVACMPSSGTTCL